MDKCGTDDGHLILFDRDAEKSWEEKIFQKIEIFRGKKIKAWGM